MNRRPPAKQHGGLWEFPGGKVEPEEHPANALVRELKEELGVIVRPDAMRPATFAQSPGSSGQVGIVILLYTVSKWYGDPRALEHGAEIAWWTPTEISSLARPPLDIELCRSLFAESDSSTPR